MAPKTDPAVELLNRNLAEAKTFHDQLVDSCERRYRAYRGIPEKGSLAASFTSQMFPKYLTQMVEAMVAAILDPNPRIQVRPRPKLGEDFDSQTAGAKTLEYLISWALDRDNYAAKQRDHVWQALICGSSVAKVSWRQDYGIKRSLAYKPTTVVDETGNPVDTVHTLQEHSSNEVVFDGPCVEIRDIRDFYWPESAVDVQSAPWVIDRVWMTPRDAKQLAADHGANVEDRDLQAAFDPTAYERETLQNRSRTKGLVPVDECWWQDRVITVINCRLKIRDDGNPFFHGQKPFVVTSAMPEPFQMTGFSVVELVAALQDQLWSLQNQRIDSLRLMNNMIMLVRSDVADIDSFEWAPGAIWPLEDIGQVKPLEINPQVPSLSLEAEALAKGDMQNVPGGSLFSGADSQTIDQKTATGVSIVSSIANKLVQARQQQFRYGHRDVVEQVGSLLQQYTRRPEAILIAGSGEQLDVDPIRIQGDVDYILDIADESIIRQERQAETLALWTSMAQITQPASMLGAKINWARILIDGLEKGFDIPDGTRYVTEAPPQPALPEQGVSPLGQPQQNGGGVTAPPAPGADVSNANSLSPAAALQQMLSQTGQTGGLG